MNIRLIVSSISLLYFSFTGISQTTKYWSFAGGAGVTTMEISSSPVDRRRAAAPMLTLSAARHSGRWSYSINADHSSYSDLSFPSNRLIAGSTNLGNVGWTSPQFQEAIIGRFFSITGTVGYDVVNQGRLRLTVAAGTGWSWEFETGTRISDQGADLPARIGYNVHWQSSYTTITLADIDYQISDTASVGLRLSGEWLFHVNSAARVMIKCRL